MDCNAEITILAVSNGFVVMPTPSFRGEAPAVSDYRVYQTMAELLEFISEHFSHRNAIVFLDQVSSEE